LTKEKIAENIRRFHDINEKKPVIVAVLEYVNESEFDALFSKETILSFKSNIFSYLKDRFKKDFDCEIIELDKKYAVIYYEEDMNKVQKALSSAVLNAEKQYELSLVSAIGKPCKTIFTIEQSFNEAMKVLDLRHAFIKKTVYTSEDLKDLKNEGYYYPLEMERDLINNVIRGKKEAADAILNRIIDENLRKGSFSEERAAQFIFSIVATINRILQQLNKTIDDYFDSGTILYIELKMCKNEEQLINKIFHIFHTIISNVSTEISKADNEIANKMISFIQNNFTKDISLMDIAEMFDLSAGYISVLFKNVTGVNFKEYLNICRVEKAKELLTKKNIKVKDVAEMVGCNNINTFIRMFKKYEGLSPGEYASQNSQ
jgi:YesN/AraC family two-component response regulator